MLAQASRQDPDSVIVPRRPQFPKPNSSDNVVSFFVVCLIRKFPLANSCRLSQTQPHWLWICHAIVAMGGVHPGCLSKALTFAFWPCPLDLIFSGAGAALSRPRTGRLRGAVWSARSGLRSTIDSLQKLPVEAAHEWLGKGALTTARFTQGQVRLPASLQAWDETSCLCMFLLNLFTSVSSVRILWRESFSKTLEPLEPQKTKNFSPFSQFLQDFQTSNLRICSRLARLPQTDELSDPRSPSRGSREATGPFQVHFAEERKILAKHVVYALPNAKTRQICQIMSSWYSKHELY